MRLVRESVMTSFLGLTVIYDWFLLAFLRYIV